MHDITELAGLIARHATVDGSHDTVIPRIGLIRSSAETEPLHTLYRPSCCIVAQGRKQAVVGGKTLVYDSAHYLVVGVDLPVIGAVIEADADRPYLCFKLELDRSLIAEMMPSPSSPSDQPAAAGVSKATPKLVDAAARMLMLLDEPDDAAALAPLLEREILYRLLRGPQGPMLRQIANGESRLNQIGRAIDYVCRNFHAPFAIRDLAAVAGMSPSSFHEHFRTTMDMSPLQFRTLIRLQEARRLMMIEGLTAAEAGFRVGYDSPSQFSRDYRRAHQATPRRDVARMRGMVSLATQN